MTAEEKIQYWKNKIDSMSHLELARFYRFSPCGHPVFTTVELIEYFDARFESLGGMTPEVSKRIGWKW